MHTFDIDRGELIVGRDSELVTLDLESGEVVARVQTSATTGYVAIGLLDDGLVAAVSEGRIEVIDRHSGPTGVTFSVSDIAAARVRPDSSVLIVRSNQRIEVVSLRGTALVQRVIDVEPQQNIALHAGQIGSTQQAEGLNELVDLESGVWTSVDLVDPDGVAYDALDLWPISDGFWARGVDGTLTRWEADRMVERIPQAGSALVWQIAHDAYAILSAPRGRRVAQLFSLKSESSGLRFSVPAEDAVAVLPSEDGGIHVLDLNGTLRTYDRDGLEISTLSIRSNSTNSSAADGRNFSVIAGDTTTRLLAIGSSDGITLVDPTAGEIDALPGSTRVTNLHFVDDGSLLVSTGHDGSVRIWDVERRAPAGLVWTEAGLGGRGSWYDDASDMIWVRTAAHVVQIPLDPARWVERACAVVGRDLITTEWDEFVPGGGAVVSAC